MSEEEIYKMLLTENIEKFPLLNEIFAIRNNKFKINDYTIYVTGCISLDVINRAIEKVNYIDKLQKENEELQKENEELKRKLKSKEKQIKLMQEMNLPDEIEKNYISKDKIRTKIKELEKDIETHNIYEENWNKIEVLKELLGDDEQ